MHAGLLPQHVLGEGSEAATGDISSQMANAEEAMEYLNSAACSWMLGERRVPESLCGEHGPLWTRVYSSPDSRDIDQAARDQLEEVCLILAADCFFFFFQPPDSSFCFFHVFFLCVSGPGEGKAVACMS